MRNNEHVDSFGKFNENSNISNVGVSLPSIKDWADMQEKAPIDKLMKDDAPITAFIEWLQKNYPNGVKVSQY